MNQIVLSYRFREKADNLKGKDAKGKAFSKPLHSDSYNPGVPYSIHTQKALDILAELHKESRIFQYTNMDDEEIFRTIYHRYDKAFGGNLSGAMYGGLGAYMQVGDNHWQNLDVWSQMNDEVTVHVTAETAIAIKMPESSRIVELEQQALYSHLRPSDRIRYISEKYPGKQTALEYCSYLRDMSQAEIIIKQIASRLATHACTKIQLYAEATLDLSTEGSFSDVLDYASDIMDTERLDIQERFLSFLEDVENEIDRIHYKTYLGNFLRSVGKNWPNDAD